MAFRTESHIPLRMKVRSRVVSDKTFADVQWQSHSGVFCYFPDVAATKKLNRLSFIHMVMIKKSGLYLNRMTTVSFKAVFHCLGYLGK